MTDDAHAEAIAGILKRQEDAGEHYSEAEIGREFGLEATQVSGLLREMQRQGHVQRTHAGNWELTPAASSRTEPRPHPREPS